MSIAKNLLKQSYFNLNVYQTRVSPSAGDCASVESWLIVGVEVSWWQYDLA
jgi:hypothetical protein